MSAAAAGPMAIAADPLFDHFMERATGLSGKKVTISFNDKPTTFSEILKDPHLKQ